MEEPKKYIFKNKNPEKNLKKLNIDKKSLENTDPESWYMHNNYLLDNKGNIIKEYDYALEQYFSIVPFYNGVSLVVNDKNLPFEEQKFALMDFDGNLLTDFFDSYDEDWIADEYICVCKNGRWGFIDKRGNQVTDFRFDWHNWDYEWEQIIPSNYELVRNYLDKEKETFKVGVFAFTGKIILEPIYKEIKIVSKYKRFSRVKTTREVLLNDIIYITGFDDKKYIWTHHHGLEEV